MSMVSEAIQKADLLEALEVWSHKYEFSFQFLGPSNNNIWIYKDGVEFYCAGGNGSVCGIIKDALTYIYKINSTPKDKRAF